MDVQTAFIGGWTSLSACWPLGRMLAAMGILGHVFAWTSVSISVVFLPKVDLGITQLLYVQPEKRRWLCLFPGAAHKGSEFTSAPALG